MSLRGKCVFISGGAGVIGTEMVQLLVNDGAEVMVGDLKPIPVNFPREVLYRQGDLNYMTQIEIDSFNPEYFIHLAATFERSEETYGHWEENFQHNILLSHHLLTLMRNVPAMKRIVNASSYLIYDKVNYQFETPRNEPVRLKETDTINPRNLTGLAKLSSEIELDFLSIFKSDTFTSVSARIYRGYGKNSRDVISRWVRSLLNNEKITVYNPTGFFDYIYAQDTARGLLNLAQTDYTGIVNLGTGKARQVNDIVKVLQQHFPSIEIEFKEQIGELIEASEANVELLKSLTNWVPGRALEDTIPDIIEFEKNRNEDTSINYGNILITSASKKIPLIQAVQSAANKIHASIKVVSADASDECLGKYFTDDFWQIPRISEIKLNQFIEECKLRNIQLIIPSRDGELEFFALNKEQFTAAGIHVMISKHESIDLCVDKLHFYDNNLELKSQIVPAVLSITELNSPKYVVKERYGAGSLSIGLNLTKDEAIEHAKTLNSPIYQPFLSGVELSIDGYIDLKGNVKGIVMRQRNLVVNGESQITTSLIDAELERKFIAIIEKLKLYGHIILQAIIDDSGAINIIECNPRFGGASTLSLKCGLDSFYWVYLESNEVDIENYPFYKATKPVKQIRFPSDFYI